MKRFAYIIPFLLLSGSIKGQSFNQPALFSSSGSEEIIEVEFGPDRSLFVLGYCTDTLVYDGVQLPFIGPFLAKLDSLNGLEWIRPAGGDSFILTTHLGFKHLEVDDQGYSYLIGQYLDTALVLDTILTSLSNSPHFMAKVDPQGNLVWARNIGFSLKLSDIEVAQSGQIIICGGAYSASSRIGSTVLDGDIVLTCGTDMLVAKYDAQGNKLWAKSYGGCGWYGDWAYGVDTDPAGNIFLGGHLRSDTWFDSIFVSVPSNNGNGYTVKLNPSGVAQWVTATGYRVYDVAADRLGNCFSTGYTNGAYFDTTYVTPRFTAFYVAKYDPNGSLDWVRHQYDVANRNTYSYGTAYSVVCDELNNVFAAGLFLSDSLVLGNNIQLPASYCGTVGSSGFILGFDNLGSSIFGKNVQSCTGPSKGLSVAVSDCRLAASR